MILLLALLCAAPEKVVVVARPQEKAGFFHKLGNAMGRAVHRLYEKDDPDVDEGNSLAAQNDPEGALKAYDRALERLPDSPELHYDRAGQMLKLGSDHATRAHEEATKALQTQDQGLRASAAFDLALSDEELGNPDQAIKDYQQALTLDPDDADSKVNLELLLKSEEERKQQQQQPQEQESKEKNQQKDQQPDKSNGEQQQKDRQKQAGEKKEEKKEQAGEQQQAQPKEERKEQRAEEQKPVDRSEAERLLDALRAGEKNLQVWRFAKDKRKETRRGDVEKDW